MRQSGLLLDGNRDVSEACVRRPLVEIDTISLQFLSSCRRNCSRNVVLVLKSVRCFFSWSFVKNRHYIIIVFLKSRILFFNELHEYTNTIIKQNSNVSFQKSFLYFIYSNTCNYYASSILVLQ